MTARDPDALAFRLREEEGAAVVSLEGRMSQGAYGAVFRRILEAVSADSLHRVVLDLSGVPYVSSAGLAAIVRIQHEWPAAGVRFCLAGATPLVARLLESVELGRIVLIRETVEEAKKAFEGT